MTHSYYYPLPPAVYFGAASLMTVFVLIALFL